MCFDWRGESGLCSNVSNRIFWGGGKSWTAKEIKKKTGMKTVSVRITFSFSEKLGDGNAPDLIPFTFNVRAAFAYNNKTSCLGLFSSAHAIVDHKYPCYKRNGAFNGYRLNQIAIVFFVFFYLQLGAAYQRLISTNKVRDLSKLPLGCWHNHLTKFLT